MLMRSLTICLLAVLFTACASKKPNNSPDALNGNAAGSNGTNAGMSLELNGESDANTAGGLSTVYFAFDSASLDESAKSTLKANAEFLKANKSVDVQVAGHCDERGGIQYNLALGEKRAKTVKDYLVAMGVAKKRIATISYGKEKPIAFGHDEDAWSKNRRANFVITAK